MHKCSTIVRLLCQRSLHSCSCVSWAQTGDIVTQDDAGGLLATAAGPSHIHHHPVTPVTSWGPFQITLAPHSFPMHSKHMRESTYSRLPPWEGVAGLLPQWQPSWVSLLKRGSFTNCPDTPDCWASQSCSLQHQGLPSHVHVSQMTSTSYISS